MVVVVVDGDGECTAYRRLLASYVVAVRASGDTK